MLADYLKREYADGVNPRALQDRVKYLLTTVAVPSQRRRAAELARGHGALKVHLGCGDTYLAGWVNVDMARPGRRLDLRWDLRRGLPLPDGSASAIFSEHFFEHLSLPSAVGLMAECRRVLEPGGIFRVGVPDLERYLTSIAGDGEFIEHYRPKRPSRVIALSEVFFFHGHRSAYDFETMRLVLEEAGFRSVVKSSFGASAIAPPPDTERRREETLYVEAVK